MSEWRTIDSAPDFVFCLVATSERKVIYGFKQSERWYFGYSRSIIDDKVVLTHWMPLPEPPSDATP